MLAQNTLTTTLTPQKSLPASEMTKSGVFHKEIYIKRLALARASANACRNARCQTFFLVSTCQRGDKNVCYLCGMILFESMHSGCWRKIRSLRHSRP